jgi:hypothetical protein
MQSVTVHRVFAPATFFTTQALAAFATNSRPSDDNIVHNFTRFCLE